MKEKYHSSRTLAIGAGIAATGGATALLLSEPLTTGHWTLDHGLVPLTVGLTVASGHLAASAARAFKPVATIGFSIAFALGTATTMLNGIGRQAEGAEAKIAEATKQNDAIASKQAELTKARARLDMANTMADKEMNGQRCLDRCKDWKTRATEVTSHIRSLEADLAKLGTTMPVNAKAAKVAELAAVLGFDGNRAGAAVSMIEPLLVPTLFELMAIVAVGFGFGHSNRRSASTVAQMAESADRNGATGGNPQPPRPRNRHSATRRVATKAVAEAEVIQLVGRGDRLPSQDKLAARWGVHKGTASKWVSEWEARGLLRREWDGRHNAIVGRVRCAAVA